MNAINYVAMLAKPVILGSMFAISGMFATSAFSATPLGTEFTAEQRLKLSRFASKNRQNTDLKSYMTLGDKRDDAFDENNSECGNIEIGNVEKPRIGQAVKPTTILITGDVINAPGGC